MNETLEICETFLSIQGESTFAGVPCFFIRLAGCNLRCRYCDTPYARAPGRRMTVDALADEFRRAGVRTAEVTGGEPLLQAATPGLVRALLLLGTVLIETNGTMDISTLPPDAIAIMDIKCPGSGCSEATDWCNVERLRPHDEVKFVVESRGDYEWARDVALRHKLAERCRAVLFSPTHGRLAPDELAGWILADRLNARLNMQLHKLIWPPDRRGV